MRTSWVAHVFRRNLLVPTLLFNPCWITPPLKEPETPQSTLTHTTNTRQHVSGSAHEPEYANQCQDFDARSFLCREDEPALALHRSSVAPRTSGCRNGWSRYLVGQIGCEGKEGESHNMGHRRRGALPRNYFLVLSWDTSNSFRLVIHHKEIFSSVAPNSLYAAAAVYDITDRESYEAIPWWFAERIKYVPESTIKIIVGNKADKERARQVSTEEAAAYAARMGCLFVETSAKTAMGVSRAFRDVVERVAETPELWVVQEPRKASQASLPESSNPSSSEPVVPARTQVETNTNRRVIGGFVLTQNTIRFGGHYYHDGH